MGNLTIGQVLPVANMILAFSAAMVYFSQGEGRHGVYWLAAAVLTASVTF